MTFIGLSSKYTFFCFVISVIFKLTGEGVEVYIPYISRYTVHIKDRIYRKPHNKFWMARESVSHPEFIFLIILGRKDDLTTRILPKIFGKIIWDIL